MSNTLLKRMFVFYQIICSFVILPISYYLWFKQLNNRHDLAILLCSIPLLFGYIIPGLGTNFLKLWEFRAGIRIGKYTLLHGLMFGGASCFLAYLCKGIFLEKTNLAGIITAAHAGAAVFGFWNWLFDTIAVKHGVAIVYNKPYFKGFSAEAVVADYAPEYFGIFGACFGVQILLLHAWALSFRTIYYWIAFLFLNLASSILPVAGYCIFSYLKHGYSGLRPYKG